MNKINLFSQNFVMIYHANQTSNYSKSSKFSFHLGKN
jgi:hypothetical protein